MFNKGDKVTYQLNKANSSKLNQRRTTMTKLTMSTPHYTVERHAHGWAVVSTVNGKKRVHTKKIRMDLAQEFADDCNVMIENWKREKQK